MKLTAPLPPNLTNPRSRSSRNWRATHRRKEKYWNALDLWRAMKKIPPPPAEPYERTEARATLYLWNPMDDGNAFARLKWLEDWLVRNRYIADDSRKHLKYAGIPEQVIDRKNQRIELELTPLEDT